VKISEEKAKGPETPAITDSEAIAPTSRYARLSLADTELILKLHLNGQTQTDIAQVIGCSQATVSSTIAKLKEAPEVTQALMRSDSLSAITDWKRARKAAAKRGDHRPSREWLEAAYPELRPQQGNSAGGGGVTINIGMPGQPIALPTIEIAPTRAALSPSVSDDLHRLNPSNTET
jgi:hypothetical protein